MTEGSKGKQKLDRHCNRHSKYCYSTLNPKSAEAYGICLEWSKSPQMVENLEKSQNINIYVVTKVLSFLIFFFRQRVQMVAV